MALCLDGMKCKLGTGLDRDLLMLEEASGTHGSQTTETFQEGSREHHLVYEVVPYCLKVWYPQQVGEIQIFS